MNFENIEKCSQINGFQVGQPSRDNSKGVDLMSILFVTQFFHFMKCFLNRYVKYMVQQSLYPIQRLGPSSLEELNNLSQFSQLICVRDGTQTRLLSPGLCRNKQSNLLRRVTLLKEGMMCFLSSRRLQKWLPLLISQTASYIEITLQDSLLQTVLCGTLIPKHISRHY